MVKNPTRVGSGNGSGSEEKKLAPDLDLDTENNKKRHEYNSPVKFVKKLFK